MKFAIGIFTTLVIIIGSVLFVQYQVYSDSREAGEHEFNYTQEIEIVFRDNSLDIRHHFKNLPDQNISITLPDNAQSVECFIQSKSSCDRLSENKSSFAAGETRSQSISYVIPVENGITKSQLLKNVFAQLKMGEAKYSIVHISTDSAIKGQWVTGLPLIGEQQLSLVNFTMFSGEGQVKDLYWDSRDIAVQEISDSLSIYSDVTLVSELKDQLKALPVLNDEHISIVQGDEKLSGYRMMFMQDITRAAVEQKVIIAQMDALYQMDSNFPQWLKEVVASYVTGTELGGDKAKKVYKIIADQMTDTQKAEWQVDLKALSGEKITPASLDKKLGIVLKSATNFLEKNSEVDTIYPFYFVDKREVVVNSKAIENVDIIYYEGRILYKAQPVLNGLGYEAKEGENGYYVNSDTRIFRFPTQPGFYVFNQRRYNTNAQPVVKLQGEYYIEESWLQRLFLVELNKTDSKINITSMNVE